MVASVFSSVEWCYSRTSLPDLRIEGSRAWMLGEVAAYPRVGDGGSHWNDRAQGGEGLCLPGSGRPMGEMVVEERPWQVVGV